MSGQKYLKHNSISLERAYDVIKSPVITEKSTFLSQFSQFVFDVSIDSSKYEIAKAVEAIFKVNVKGVTTLNRQGKIKRFKGRLGKRTAIKRAYVQLLPGQSIDVGGQL